MCPRRAGREFADAGRDRTMGAPVTFELLDSVTQPGEQHIYENHSRVP
jgi:hypothetical protein